MTSEATNLSQNDTASPDLPLSVLLFYTAMCQNIALSEFAQGIGINPLSLRQFISGQAQRPRGRTIELLAAALDMPIDEVRRRATLPATSAPRFNDWFKEKLNGHFSRAKLTKETHISDGALRNYLSGQTLPDPDQAQRLAETLNIHPLELAKVLVADHIVRNGGKTIPPSEEGGQDERVTHTGLAQAGDVPTSSHHTTPTSHSLLSGGEDQMLTLWRRLHPQGRRATLNYIAALLAEEV